MNKMGLRRLGAAVLSFLLALSFTVGSALPALAAETGSELVVDDRSYDLETLLGWYPQTTDIKLSVDSLGFGSGMYTLPSTIRSIQGWQKGTFFDREGEKVRTFGNDRLEGKGLTFAAGSNVLLRNITFGMNADHVIAIEKGATVQFENCTFPKKLLNNGTASFTNCTFKNGIITNNGTASYNNTTEPENDGTPSDEQNHTPLTLSVGTDRIDGVIHQELSEAIAVSKGGTDADTADWEAVISPEDSGLTATWNEDTITVSGTPERAGSYTLTLTGKTDDESVQKEISIAVADTLQVRLEGALADYAIGQDASTADAVSSASIGGGFTNSAKAELEVKEGDGDWQSYSEFSTQHPGASYQFAISPEGSNLTANMMLNSIYLSGTAGKAGTYRLSATVTDGKRSATSNALTFHIFDLNVSFADRLKAVEESVSSWMMAPWNMINTKAGATIPNHFKEISGSDESGLYGIIGTNDSLGTDEIVIPEGTDVTFRNMKFQSSTKLIVKKGGRLVLDDSVAYGPVVVEGGTFSAKNTPSIVGGLTLNDGSTLEDADIKGTYYLTDGNPDLEYPGELVTVNGNVTVKGENHLKGSVGGGPSLPGQTALKVNGTITMEDGSTLEAIGGGDKLTFYSPYGGDGIVLDNGTIKGSGTLVAKGGDATNGVNGDTNKQLGGDGISGIGTVDVKSLTSTGGDSGEEGSVFGKGPGGNGVTPNIKVRADELNVKGGYGSVPGSSEVTKYDSDQVAPNPNTGKDDDKGNTSNSDKDKPSNGETQKLTMYRLYNPNSGEHFYTSDPEERKNVVAAGWDYEGIGWIAPSAGDPVYRLYNANGGEHHYTMSASEKDSLIALGWFYEGISWYSDTEKTVPVNRQYNPNQFSNNHNYTVSAKEKNHLIAEGWKDEGIGWYAID
jgi:hypothetical protein